MGIGVKSLFSSTCLIWTLLWLAACDPSFLRNDLEAIQTNGHLTMVTRISSATYYQGPNGPAGFEYDLAKAFADHLGVELRVVVLKDEADMITALRKGKADIIAAGFPFGEQATRLLAMGPGYLEIQEMIIGRLGSPGIPDPEDQTGATIWTTANSTRIEWLKQLQDNTGALNWQISNEYDDETMLEMVWKRHITMTVVESHIFKLNHRFYPELIVNYETNSPRYLAWAMAPTSRHLQKAVVNWFALPATQEIVKELIEHYFNHLDNFDYVDMIRFKERIHSRLPNYQDLFIAAGKKYNMDWQLIAAQAYQESHWNPKAISFTGVRGMMMLTLETARELGVANRLVVEDSIDAGAEYLIRLHSALDDDIDEPDRTFMALAAYNMGMSHLQDARKLALQLGKSNTTWGAMRLVLPLLHEKKYYQDLDYGYARGLEARQYVDRIRTYHKVLQMKMSSIQETEKQEMAVYP